MKLCTLAGYGVPAMALGAVYAVACVFGAGLFVHTYCEMRPAIAALVLVGVCAAALCVACFAQKPRSRWTLMAAALLFLTGAVVPGILLVDAMKVCAAQAGK